MRSIVITGTSSGIGYETARYAIANKTCVFGCVRNIEDGERLTAELGSCFIPLLFDVRDEEAIEAQAQYVRSVLGGEKLLGLVNNAGIGIAGPILHQPSDEIRAQLETNLFSLFWMVRAFGPLLGTDASLSGEPGRIVNLSSIAGTFAQPFAAAYVASKHGAEGFSDALRREMALYGIKVVVVAPTVVDTPIWDKMRRHRDRYDETDYAPSFHRGVDFMLGTGRRNGVAAEKVAATIWRALTAENPRLRYAPARFPIIEEWGARRLPKRIVDWGIERMLGLLPAKRA